MDLGVVPMKEYSALPRSPELECNKDRSITFLVRNHYISSIYRASSTDFPNSFSPFVSIVHLFQQVFYSTCCIRTELLYIGSNWSFCLCSSVWWCPLENVAYEFVLTSQQCPVCLIRLIWMFFLDGKLVAIYIYIYIYILYT